MKQIELTDHFMAQYYGKSGIELVLENAGFNLEREIICTYDVLNRNRVYTQRS